ncbi:MAG: Ig-like domain-containing protein [Actinomycetota bacterium]|nr:Ig-like domain-containing protein [Actinomycetota bacterium]
MDLTAPANASTVKGSVNLTATASDTDGISKVEFYVDGTLLAVDTASPYATTWDTTDVTDGHIASRRRPTAGPATSGRTTTPASRLRTGPPSRPQRHSPAAPTRTAT